MPGKPGFAAPFPRFGGRAMTIRTTFEQAWNPDGQFARDLSREIMRTIADASEVTDHHKLIALRIGETTEALIMCLAATLSCSERLRVPSQLRAMTEAIEKRLRHEVRQAQDANFHETIMGNVGPQRGHA
jgi:hypothetical protein